MKVLRSNLRLRALILSVTLLFSVLTCGLQSQAQEPLAERNLLRLCEERYSG